jgi:hypothetical protein
MDKTIVLLGVVTHACSTSYLGGRDGEDNDLWPAQSKVNETPISINKLGIVTHAYDPSYMRGTGRRIAV